jgi:hypothetical protein
LRSSIGLVLGRMPQPSSPPATGARRLGDASDVDGSEGTLSNPESHTFGLPVVGGAGNLLPRRAGVRARTLENDLGRSSVSVSSSESSSAAAMSARARSARGQAVSLEPRSSRSSEGERQGTQLQSAHSFGSQGSRQQQRQEEETPPSPSILSQSVRSEDITSESTTTQTVTLAQAMSEVTYSTFTGTDSSWSTNFFLAFTTSTIFTTSTRGLEHGADIVRDGATYDR